MKKNKKLKCFLENKKCNFPFEGNNIRFSYEIKRKKYYRCSICMLSFQKILQGNVKIVNKEVNKFYNKIYYKKTYKDKNIMFKKREKQYNIDKKYLLKSFNDQPNKKILDYGCGNGEFLNKFKSKKYGYEINPNIQKKSKIKYLKTNEISKIKFDLIIMRGVIEHIPEFYSVCKKLFKSLKKNGIFFITATPNNLSLPYFNNPKKFHLNNERHIYNFNHVNLGAFFLKNNFLNTQVVFQYLETAYKNLNQDFLSLKKNKKSTAHPGNMMTLSFKKMK